MILPEPVLNKARKYCAYQERSQQEVRDKLYEWGLHREQVEAAIALLITENFINEERFAIAYAGGKFRIKQWGRIKIRYALQQKKISPYCIRKALSEISPRDYRGTLIKLASARRKKTTEKNPVKKNYQVAQYLIGRGYEPELIWEVLGMEQ